MNQTRWQKVKGLFDAVVERKGEHGRQYVFLGPRLDAPPMDVFEGAVLFDEPGVKAVEFSQRAHALAHFLRATAGTGFHAPSPGQNNTQIVTTAFSPSGDQVQTGTYPVTSDIAQFYGATTLKPNNA